MRHRVAIVTGQLGFGGAERQIAELAPRARAHGVECEVFCLGGSDEPWGPVLRAAGVEVVSVPRRGGFDWRRVLDLAARLRGRSFDVVHSFLIDSNPYAFLAARLAGVPAFLASNRNADFPRAPVRAPIDAFVFRRAAAIVVNARAVRDFTARRFGIPPERFAVIYNGVDVERFRPRPAARAGVPAIGTVGSLSAKKNPELFAQVAAIVRGRNGRVRCRHLGEGPLRADLAARYGDVVELAGSSRSVEEFLAGLDVFVLTSDREGCPNALLEAMACGLAVVTTDAGGSREIVEDGVTGFVAPRGDAEALAGPVCRLLADEPLRLRLGAAARRAVEERFTVPRMVEEMTALYRRSAAPAGSRPSRPRESPAAGTGARSPR